MNSSTSIEQPIFPQDNQNDTVASINEIPLYSTKPLLSVPPKPTFVSHHPISNSKCSLTLENSSNGQDRGNKRKIINTEARSAQPPFKSQFELEKLNQRQLVQLIIAHQQYWNPVLAQRVKTIKARTRAERRGQLKQFNWERYSIRHVAFQVAYIGWDFSGFFYQKDVENTVEGVLMDVFKRLYLIKDLESANWQRAGRTDKGVSALGQVISVNVRSTSINGLGVVQVGSQVVPDLDELDYITMLNGTLPPEIRILGWTPVPPTFSARFSAIYRTYKYFFVKEQLDTSKMQLAADHFIGEYDFRNFCKMDAINVKKYRRYVMSCTIQLFVEDEELEVEVEDKKNRATLPITSMLDKHLPFGNQPKISPYSSDVYVITIRGSAFLWHQVRCMVEVLFMVGRGQEEHTIVADLLDNEKYIRKPIYPLASELPLILYDVGYFQTFFQVNISAQIRLSEHFSEMFDKKIIMAKTIDLARMKLNSSTVSMGSRKKRYINEKMARKYKFSIPGEFEDPGMVKIDDHDSATDITFSLAGEKANHSDLVLEEVVTSNKNELGDVGCVQWNEIREQIRDIEYVKLTMCKRMSEKPSEDTYDERIAKLKPRKSQKVMDGGYSCYDSNNYNPGEMEKMGQDISGDKY